jgi:hypothetical protein
MLLHYDCLAEFKRQIYKEVLTRDNLVSGQIKIDKLSFEDGSTDDEANFWGYILEKDGVKYLLSCRNASTNQEIDIKYMFPLIPRNLLKVAYKGQAYYQIQKPIVARWKPQKSMEFKDLIKSLTPFQHSNPKHQTIMAFISLASMMDKINIRVSSPASFGKDSMVDTLGHLFGNAATLENPTLAKLEFMTTYKWLAVNEVIDIGKAEWRIIEQFLLSAGAHKPEITKHSRAVAGGVKEILDISQFSLALLYNDIDHYPEFEKYFDFVTKKAVLNRFPALRLHGVLQADFNKIKDINVPKYVSENIDLYKEIIYNFEYYKQNFYSLLKGFNHDKLKPMPERWKVNMGRVLKIVDLYCDTQEEFDSWVKEINKCMIDYSEMMKYPELRNKNPELDVSELNTFIDKNETLKKGRKPIKDTGLSSFWEDKK